MRVSGTSGTEYSVDVFNYDQDGGLTFETLTGTIGESGSVDLPVQHLLSTKFGAVLSPDTLVDGTGVDYEGIDGIVTAVVPGVGFYLQSPTGYTNHMFVQYSSGGVQFGDNVMDVVGVVGSVDGHKIVNAAIVESSGSVSPPSPVAISPELATECKHLYARTFGRVTESDTDYVMLNGGLKVWLLGAEYPVDCFISVDGVEHGGEFFVGSVDSVQLLAASVGGYSGMRASVADGFAPPTTDNGFAWRPHPTVEEILASAVFQERYNREGAIGWAPSQPDGAVVDLPDEMVISESEDGLAFGLKETFEPIQHGPQLTLILNRAVHGLRPMLPTIDVVGGTLTTLADGRRAIVNAAAVYAHTDASGRYYTMGLTRKPGDPRYVADPLCRWPWIVRLAP